MLCSFDKIKHDKSETYQSERFLFQRHIVCTYALCLRKEQDS